MPTVSKQKPQPWRKGKAKIIEHYGSITALASEYGVSTEAIRQAVTGTGCPALAKRLPAKLFS